jgi:hypothetical protein
MTEFAPYGGSYDSGHPWYYKQGGRILTPEEIIDQARNDLAKRHFVQQYAKFDRMEDPRRSIEIAEAIKAIEHGMQLHITRYLECVKELETLRTVFGPWPYDWVKETYNEPNLSVSLKHNHISYSAAQIKALRSFQTQGDLFG